jgi:BatD DUF11 like domain
VPPTDVTQEQYTVRSRSWQSILRARRGRKLFLSLLRACLIGLLCADTANAVTFTASLDHDTITLGESASLSLTFEGASPNNVPPLPPIVNLQISYVGPSSQFSFVNGQTSSTVTYNFRVTPRQIGDYTIPAVTVMVNGQRLSSQPLQLKVLKPNAPPPAAVKSGSQVAFMRLVLPKKEIYLGEPVMGEMQIYFRNEVQNFGNFQITAMPAEGFTVGKKIQGQQRRAQIGNAIYTIVPLDFALTPIKTGPLTLGPITASMVVELPSSRQGDAFDAFGFPNFFRRNEQRQLNLATEAENVQSLPLPTVNVPPGFNGAVGNYTMTVTAGPTNVATGDPITVHVQISGRGDLEGLKLPEQTAWKDFKSYPPTADIKTSDQLGLQGTKTFEEVVTPESPSIKELPPFSFSFFDPDTKAYRTLTQPGVALTVRPGGTTPVPVVAMRNSSADELPPAQGIVAIKTRLGSLAQIGPPLAVQPWFLAVQATPLLAFLAAFVWRKRTDSLANNPRLRRQREVARIIHSGLEELRAYAAEMNSDAFFAALVRLLQEQIGERLDCPASAITEAVVDEKLRPRGLPDASLEALHELFQAANLARYSPVRSEQEFVAMVPKLETVLHELREMKS